MPSTLFIAIAMIACSRATNNIQPIGSYCGVNGQEFKNPLSNETIDEKVFSEITTLPEAIYKAESLSILVKNSLGSEEQVMYSHRQVFDSEGNVQTIGFLKSCARGITPESTGQFKVSLPLEVTLKSDYTWMASKAATYSIKYGREFNAQGFLIGSVEDISGPDPTSSLEFDFPDYVFLEQIGNLSKAQKASKADPTKTLDQIFLQIKVSDSPESYARIVFRKIPDQVIPTALAPETVPVLIQDQTVAPIL